MIWAIVAATGLECHCLARRRPARHKRLALASIIPLCGLNGRRLTLTNDAAYDLVLGVAAGEPDSVEEIATVLRRVTRPARQLGAGR
jgi:death-on-curing protein